MIPKRMTGAEKLMLGMFGGGWKFGGNPPGRLGLTPWDCGTGGALLTPGAAGVPGGGPGFTLLIDDVESFPREGHTHAWWHTWLGARKGSEAWRSSIRQCCDQTISRVDHDFVDSRC